MIVTPVAPSAIFTVGDSSIVNPVEDMLIFAVVVASSLALPASSASLAVPVLSSIFPAFSVFRVARATNAEQVDVVITIVFLLHSVLENTEHNV